MVEELIYTDTTLSISKLDDELINVDIFPFTNMVYSKEHLKIIVESLVSWYNKEFKENCLRIVGNNLSSPKIVVDSKKKVVTLLGIKIIKDDNKLVMDSQNFTKLQELVLNSYYE